MRATFLLIFTINLIVIKTIVLIVIISVDYFFLLLVIIIIIIFLIWQLDARLFLLRAFKSSSLL